MPCLEPTSVPQTPAGSSVVLRAKSRNSSQFVGRPESPAFSKRSVR